MNKLQVSYGHQTDNGGVGEDIRDEVLRLMGEKK